MRPTPMKSRRKRSCASGATRRRWQPDRVKFTTWLYRIARNLAIDRHRKHRETNDEDLEQIVDDAPDTGHAIDAERRRKLMQNAIAQLPERQRTALVLCHFDGMSNQDAAAVLEVTRRCARVAARRAPAER